MVGQTNTIALEAQGAPLVSGVVSAAVSTRASSIFIISPSTSTPTQSYANSKIAHDATKEKESTDLILSMANQDPALPSVPATVQVSADMFTSLLMSIKDLRRDISLLPSDTTPDQLRMGFECKFDHIETTVNVSAFSGTLLVSQA